MKAFLILFHSPTAHFIGRTFFYFAIDPYYEEIQSTDFPTVLIDLENKNPKIGSIGIDNRAAGMEITDFLIDNGHQQIGMINGSKYASVSLQRQLGYQDALIDRT